MIEHFYYQEDHCQTGKTVFMPSWNALSGLIISFCLLLLGFLYYLTDEEATVRGGEAFGQVAGLVLAEGCYTQNCAWMQSSAPFCTLSSRDCLLHRDSSLVKIKDNPLIFHPGAWLCPLHHFKASLIFSQRQHFRQLPTAMLALSPPFGEMDNICLGCVTQTSIYLWIYPSFLPSICSSISLSICVLAIPIKQHDRVNLGEKRC